MVSGLSHIVHLISFREEYSPEVYCKLIVIIFDFSRKKGNFRWLDANSNKMLELRNGDCCFPGGQQLKRLLEGTLSNESQK